MKSLIPSFLTLTLAWSANAADTHTAAWTPEKGARYEILLCAGQSNIDVRAPAKALTGELAK